MERHEIGVRLHRILTGSIYPPPPSHRGVKSYLPMLLKAALGVGAGINSPHLIPMQANSVSRCPDLQILTYINNNALTNNIPIILQSPFAPDM